MANRKPLVFLPNNNVSELPDADTLSWTWLGDVPGNLLSWSGIAPSSKQNALASSTSVTLVGSELRRAALTGDVTATVNSNATTIAANAVTNAKLADVATGTLKGRTAAGTGDPTDLTAAQVRTLLNVADGATANAGTVTSVNATSAGGPLSFVGPPITSSGTLDLQWTLGTPSGWVLKSISPSNPPEFGPLSTQNIPNLHLQGSINGFAWKSTASAIDVASGVAHIQSTGELVSYSGGKISGSIPANTWLHLYLHSSGSLLPSVTAPAAPYFGTARSMTGNTAYRYLFSIRSGVGGALPIMKGDGGGSVSTVTYLQNTGLGVTQLVNSSTAATPTDASAVDAAPANVTTDLVLRLYNISPSGSVRIYCWSGTAFVVWTNIPSSQELYAASVPCDSAPKVQYDSVSGGSATINLYGYTFAR